MGASGPFVDLLGDTVEMLVNLPAVRDARSRHALLLRAGLDSNLMAQVDVAGSPAEFLTRTVDFLSHYGHLEQNVDALTAFLDACKGLLGVDKQRTLSKLSEAWETTASNRGLSQDVKNFMLILQNRWTQAESPLLPAECQFSEVASSLDLMAEATTIRDWRPVGEDRSKHEELVTGRLEVNTLLDSPAASRRIVVLGHPGSGKSTFLNQLAAIRASQALMEQQASLVPLLISVALFSRQLVEKSNASLFDYVDLMGNALLARALGSEFRTLSRRGRMLLLLDGMDEIAEEQRASVLERVAVAVSNHPGNIVLITSRLVGYTPLVGYSSFRLASLTIDDQRRLLLALCGEEKTKRLLAEIAGRQELRELTEVPMMLTVIALVARETANLEQVYFRRQSDLLKQAARILLEGKHRRRNGVNDSARANKVLGRLSLRLHESSSLKEGDETFTDREIEAQLAEMPMDWLASWSGAGDFLQDVSKSSNILYPIDVLAQRYRYLHRTFREYFAALELSRLDMLQRRAFVKAIITRHEWHQVLILLGGMVDDVSDYLLWLLEGPTDLALRTLKEVDNLDPALAETVLRLAPVRAGSRRASFIELTRKLPKEETIVDVLWSYMRSASQDIPRIDLYFIQETMLSLETALAQELLGELFSGLPNPPEDLFESLMIAGEPGPYWCHVPVGECEIGADLDDPDRPAWVPVRHTAYVSAFELGRFPVTNAIYERFDPLHKNKREFTDRVSQHELDDHPVVSLTWYEAAVFCDWASSRFAGLRLPTEAEWEKAASWTGERKLRFPWGDDWNPKNLNCWQAGPNRTTKVTEFPQGRSPWGALDMAGNVWEWTLDWFSEPTSIISNSSIVDPFGPLIGDRRVDRGGGWYHDVGRPAAFLRAADSPQDSFGHCGFRVVLSRVPHSKGRDLFPGGREPWSARKLIIDGERTGDAQERGTWIAKLRRLLGR